MSFRYTSPDVAHSGIVNEVKFVDVASMVNRILGARDISGKARSPESPVLPRYRVTFKELFVEPNAERNDEGIVLVKVGLDSSQR